MTPSVSTGSSLQGSREARIANLAMVHRVTLVAVNWSGIFLNIRRCWTDDEVERSKAVLNVLNDKLTTSPYLLGSEFSVADLNVAMIVAANSFAKISLSGKPNLLDWLRRCWRATHARPRTSCWTL